jgi:hypothetical protein
VGGDGGVEESREGLELCPERGEVIAVEGVLADLGADVLDCGDGGSREFGGEDWGGDGFWFGGVGFEDETCAGDGVALVVEQGLDAEGGFYVAFTVEALASAAFVGFELGEFGLPEAEDVGGDVAEFGDVADAEVELVRNDDGVGGNGFADWVMGAHSLVQSIGLEVEGCQWFRRFLRWFAPGVEGIKRVNTGFKWRLKVWVLGFGFSISGSSGEW